MTKKRVYLDYAATTPVDPRVLEAMMPFFNEDFGNPSSIHLWGQQAESAVEQSRELVAQILGCSPQEILFTSCGSESDNLAIRGAAFHARQNRDANVILTTPVEHHAVQKTAEMLAQLHGFEVEYLSVDETGRINPAELAERIDSRLAIVSIIFGNNEIGSINPITEVGNICSETDVPFHTDAIQAWNLLPNPITDLKVDLLSLSAHKFYGPKGVGVLYIKQGTGILPIQTGGDQENGLRAGTHNVPLIVGFAESLKIAASSRAHDNHHVQLLRDKIIEGVLSSVPNVRLTGHSSDRLPNHASFVFRDIDATQLLAGLDLHGFGCSSGSACKTGDPEPSEVLSAIGLPDEWSLGALRVTVGRDTSEDSVSYFLYILPEVVRDLRRVKA